MFPLNKHGMLLCFLMRTNLFGYRQALIKMNCFDLKTNKSRWKFTTWSDAHLITFERKSEGEIDTHQNTG